MKILQKIMNVLVHSVKIKRKTAVTEDEMERAISRLEQQYYSTQRTISVALADTKRMEMDCKELNDQAEQWHGKAAAALEGGDEKSARKALEKEAVLRKRIPLQSEEQAEQKRKTDKLLAALDQMKTQLGQMKRDYNMLLARKEAASTKKQMAQAAGEGGKKSIASGMEQMMDEAMRLEAEADVILSMHSIVSSDKALEEKFAAIELEESVDAAFDKLTAELKDKRHAAIDPKAATTRQ